MEYSRPAARGRELFGGVVQWESTWTPGANWATTIAVDKDVRIDNQPLPKGKYSIWIQIRKDKEWKVMFSRLAKVYHLWPPLLNEEELSLSVMPERGLPVEMLTWSFPAVMRDGASLWMQWGTTVLALYVAVEPTLSVALTPQEKSKYVGTWDMSVEAHGADTSFIARLEIAEAEGGLTLTGQPFRSGDDPRVDLMSIGGHQFHPVYYRKRQRLGMESRETFIFAFEDGHTDSFEVRDRENKPLAYAFRVR